MSRVQASDPIAPEDLTRVRLLGVDAFGLCTITRQRSR